MSLGADVSKIHQLLPGEMPFIEAMCVHTLNVISGEWWEGRVEHHSVVIPGSPPGQKVSHFFWLLQHQVETL